MADSVVLVVDARHDRLPVLLRAKEILRASTAAPVGVVMNCLQQRGRNRYYVATLPNVSKNKVVAMPVAGAPSPLSPSNSHSLVRDTGPDPSLMKNTPVQQSMSSIFQPLPFARPNEEMLPPTGILRKRE
jgi:hypothetical protein